MTRSRARGALPCGLSRSGLLDAVRAVLDAEVPHGAGVVLAVSGGPDSTALAYLVTEARPDLQARVAHIRHGLRDDQHDADTAAEHASALGLRFHERRIRVDPAAGGPEAAARDARYAALAAVARTERARWVLVGHTADDQAETVVLNLGRGTGLRGLAGMGTVRRQGDVRIVRPLIRVRRADVRSFVHGEGLSAVSDPTNTDPAQRRARARGAVLPALAGLSGGPGDPVGVLTRLADLARDDADALDALAASHARTMIVAWGPVRAVASHALEVLAPAVAGRVVRLAVDRVGGRRGAVGAEGVAALMDLRPGQAMHLPGGVWATSGGGWLAFIGPDAVPLQARDVALPGVTPLPEIGQALHADLPWGPAAENHAGQRRLDLGALSAPTLGEVRDAPPGPLASLPPRALRAASGTPAWVALPEGLPAGLHVRSRRPGDRIRLSGGRRKLQDVLVDAAVPRAARAVLPIVVDADDEPLWIPGVALRVFDQKEPAGARLWVAPDRPAPDRPAPDRPAG